MGDTEHVPIARFLSEAEAYPLAGRLRAEGIEAEVVPQDQLNPYGGPRSAGRVVQVLVPARDAARARWILDRVG